MPTYDPRNGAAAYVHDQVHSESALARIARIYELAVVDITRARMALRRGDSVARGTAINRAMRCIAVLQSALNKEDGGDVAVNLDRIYAYAVRRLSEGHAHGDDGALEEICRHFSELGSAWRQAADTMLLPQQPQPVQQAGSAP